LRNTFIGRASGLWTYHSVLDVTPGLEATLHVKAACSVFRGNLAEGVGGGAVPPLLDVERIHGHQEFTKIVFESALTADDCNVLAPIVKAGLATGNPFVQ